MRNIADTGHTGDSPTVHARMVCAPDFAVTSARFPLADSTLWIATREADAARKDTFLPAATKPSTTKVCIRNEA